MTAYVIPNFLILDTAFNSTNIAGFLFLGLSLFKKNLIRRFMDNESGLPGGEMEFRDVTSIFLEAADGKYIYRKDYL